MTVMATTNEDGAPPPKIDVAALPKMTTKELSALAKARGVGGCQSRGEFINALVEVYQNDQERDDGTYGGGDGRAYGGGEEEVEEEEDAHGRNTTWGNGRARGCDRGL